MNGYKVPSKYTRKFLGVIYIVMVFALLLKLVTYTNCTHLLSPIYLCLCVVFVKVIYFALLLKIATYVNMGSSLVIYF